MKRTLLLFCLLLLVTNCQTEENINNSDSTTSREELFFRNASSKEQIFGETNSIETLLKDQNKDSHFLKMISDQKGIPIWEHVKTFKNRSLAGKNSGSSTAIVPLSDNGKNLSSLLFVENTPNRNPNIYTITNDELFEIVSNKEISVKVRENILIQFLYFDYMSFGRRLYTNIPEDLFSNIQVKKNKNYKEFKISVTNEQTSSPTSRQVSDICISYNVCDGRCGARCDECPSCQSTKCYSFGGTYNPLNYGDSYGGGGGSDSGSSGGGSSGGGSTANGPWYLMNPDIDIYTYNSKIRNVFKNLTDYNIILQREQLDYLNNNVTILNDLTALLVNNTREKSEFTNNVISALNDGGIKSYKDFTTILEDFKISLKSPFNIDRFAINSATPEGAKFNSIYTSLTNSPMFVKLFLNIFGGPQQKFNVKFEIADHVNEDDNPAKKEVNAITIKDPVTNNIIIKINKQILITGTAKSQNNIENAKTILHECIHAYLFIKANHPSVGIDFVKILNTMYPTEKEQHDFMYDKMIPTMQIVLSEIRDSVTTVRGRTDVSDLKIYKRTDNSEFEIWNWNSYYKFISLNGLEDANCFKSDFPAQSNELDFYINYINGGKTWLDKEL